jgi:serine/threonine-protein kinase
MCHAARVTRDDDNGIGDRTEVVPYDQAMRRPSGSTPKRLGRYTLQRIIAQGGMAEIWLATTDGSGGVPSKVVVKRIRPSLVKQAMREQAQQGGQNRTVEMFVREARLLARLQHKNVVAVYELGVQPPKREGGIGEHFIVMEHLEGITLKDLALRAWDQKRPLPIETVVRAVADVCLGLDHAHRLADERGQPANVVHRDISPDNLFVTTAGITKVLDFGIAKREGQAALTMAGELKGKVPYMSPEQLKGVRIDGRTDLFAIGVVLYWLLTGRRPFDGPSDIFTMKAILDDAPVSLRQLNPEVPVMLEDIVLSCLHKDPDARISSAAALYDALSMILMSSADVPVELTDLVASLDDVATPSFEVVPEVAAINSRDWAARYGAPGRAPVPVVTTFEPTNVPTSPSGQPPHLDAMSVGAPRGNRSTWTDPPADAATVLQIDPADLPSTIPPSAPVEPPAAPTLVRAVPITTPEAPTMARAAPITAEDPTRQRRAPSILPLPPPPAASQSPLPPPPPAARGQLPPAQTPTPTSLPPPPVADGPTVKRDKPSWKDAVPEGMRDTFELSADELKEDLAESRTRLQSQPSPSLTSPTSTSPLALPPDERSGFGVVVAVLMGGLVAIAALAAVAYGMGFFDRAAVAGAGVDAGALVVESDVVDAGVAPVAAVAAVTDAGVAAAVDAGAEDAVDLPAGDDSDVDDDNTVDGGVADAVEDDIVDAPQRPRHRRRPPRVKQPPAVGEGFLVVRARPWAKVFIDGLGLGTTPLPALPLPSGKHRLKLEHEGIVKYHVVTVEAGKTATVQIDMRE